MVRFHRLTSWRSWDLLHEDSVIPESNILEPKSPSDCQGQARRRKNMTEFLGEANIPSPDALGQLGGSLPSAGGESWKNRAANRFSVLFSSNTGAGTFGKEVDQLEQLQSKLHSYTKFGLPKVPHQLSFHHDSWEDKEEELEDSWQSLLDNPEGLTRRQVHQQEAVWELLQTEATYIRKLRVITEHFLSSLLNLQDCGLLTEVEPSRLFSNIQEILHLHTTLWNQVMQPVLEKARQARMPLDPTNLHEGFSTFGSRFQPYIRYCMEEEACMEYMRSLLRENELFRTYVTWAETHKQCNRLKLTDMLAKPHQRLTKYPLLLKIVLKKTDDPSARDMVSGMVAAVERFINSVDSQMRQCQEQQKLATISARIESYEAVEGSSEEVEKILKEFNRFDLMAPMRGVGPEETRQLHLEGALRMKEGKESRMDVYCFLFTDLLLITKPVKRVEKVKIIRQPLMLHNVVCKELKDPGSFVLIYLNEFKGAVAAYTFQANSASQGRSWVDAVCNVQNQLRRLQTEEELRLQRCLQGEEDEEEDESSNSTTSSPALRHKESQNSSQSDGSTETLSVMEVDEPAEPASSAANMNLDGTRTSGLNVSTVSEGCEAERSPHRVQSGLFPEQDGDVEELQCRSLSMDSAYGTLSPMSLLRELEPAPGQSEGEETEEEGELREVEVTVEEEEEEEEEEEDSGSLGSQVSVVQSCKPRRRPHVQPRAHPLPTLSSQTLSRSEDNLLQRLRNRTPLTHTRSLHIEALDRLQRREADSLSLPHSRSLSELGRPWQDETSPPDKLIATLMRAEAARRSGGGARSRDSTSSPTYAEDESTGRMSPAKRKSPTPHKKLTLAQLHRIRTTMVLNSTLTASEV